MTNRFHALLAALVLSGAASFSPAAEIKLEDILAPAAQPQPSEPVATPAAAASPADRLAALMAPGGSRPAAARLGELEELMLAISPEDPLLLEGQALRVALLGETRRAAEAELAATDFLAGHPDHAQAWRTRAVLGWAQSTLGKQASAAETYRAVAAPGTLGELPEYVVWEGCELFAGEGDGAMARRLMEFLLEPSTAGGRSMKEWWLLESLLVADDRTVDVPPAPAAGAPLRASIQARRALLLHLRGRTAEALELRTALEADARSLAPAEAKALAAIK